MYLVNTSGAEVTVPQYTQLGAMGKGVFKVMKGDEDMSPDDYVLFDMEAKNDAKYWYNLCSSRTRTTSTCTDTRSNLNWMIQTNHEKKSINTKNTFSKMASRKAIFKC